MAYLVEQHAADGDLHRQSEHEPDAGPDRGVADLARRRHRRSATTTCSTAFRSPTCRIARRPSPSIEMLEDVKVQVHTYDAEMGRTGGGVFNASARSGTNAFRGSAFGLMRPGALIGQNFFLKLQDRPNPDQFWRNAGGGVRRADHSEQDVLLGRGRGLPRRPDAERQPPCPDRSAMRNGDFSALTDTSRPADHHLRPAHDRSGDRRPAAVSRQHHSGQPHQPGRREHR